MNYNMEAGMLSRAIGLAQQRAAGRATAPIIAFGDDERSSGAFASVRSRHWRKRAAGASELAAGRADAAGRGEGDAGARAHPRRGCDGPVVPEPQVRADIPL